MCELIKWPVCEADLLSALYPAPPAPSKKELRLVELMRKRDSKSQVTAGLRRWDWTWQTLILNRTCSLYLTLIPTPRPTLHQRDHLHTHFLTLCVSFPKCEFQSFGRTMFHLCLTPNTRRTVFPLIRHKWNVGRVGLSVLRMMKCMTDVDGVEVGCLRVPLWSAQTRRHM